MEGEVMARTFFDVRRKRKEWIWWSWLPLVLSLAGCSLVTDPGASFGLRREGSLTDAACLLACDAARDTALAAEWLRHKQILGDVCGPLPWAEEAPCRTQEHARYALAKQVIYLEREDCKVVCRYAEGSAQAGR